MMLILTPSRLLSTVLVLAFLASVGPAWGQQSLRWTALARPIQGTGRFLGLGYTQGYHQGTPGPNVDYYHPHTAQNSQRIARGTEHRFPLIRPYSEATGSTQPERPPLEGIAPPELRHPSSPVQEPRDPELIRPAARPAYPPRSSRSPGPSVPSGEKTPSYSILNRF